MNLSLHRAHTAPKIKRIRPVRDWLILVSIFVVFLFASVGYNVWLLSKVIHGQALGDMSEMPEKEALELAPIDEVFDARAAEQERYRTQLQFADPSR